MPYVYLLQPPILKGTDRYKIGLSNNNSNERISSYGASVDLFCKIYCSNPKKVELVLKKEFANNFKLIHGNEWFEGNINHMINLFNEIVNQHKCVQPNKKNITNTNNDLKNNIRNKLISHFDNPKSYICLRCKYSSDLKANLEKHLNRKKLCKLRKFDVSIVDIKLFNNIQKPLFNNKKNINICQYCYKEFSCKQSKSRHENHYCKKKNIVVQKYITKLSNLVENIYNLYDLQKPANNN